MSCSRVITVTLNPSLDRTLTTHFMATGYQNFTSGSTRLDPSGHGVNISRALHRLGTPTHALILLGTDAVGRAYRTLMADDEFPYTIIDIDGPTRSNIVIHDTGKHHETELTEERTDLSEEDIVRAENALREMVTADDRVVLAGGLPHNAPPATYARFVRLAKAAGAHVTLAVSSQQLEGALSEQPNLVATTEHELENFFNSPVRSRGDVTYFADKLRQKVNGRIIVELRETRSALLTSAHGNWMIQLPEEHAGTDSGVWDALLAGYLSGRVEEKPLDEAFRIAAASAVYTADQVGNEFGDADSIDSGQDIQPEMTPRHQNGGGMVPLNSHPPVI